MAGKKKTSTAVSGDGPSDAEKAKLRATKFAKGASVHVTRCLASLDKIAALGNRRRYNYTTEQAQKIMDAIDGRCELIARAFNPEQTGAVKQKFEV